MDNMLLHVFRDEVARQCRHILLATEELQRSFSTDPPDIVGIWYSIQNLLNASANISKACWGSRGRKAKEREVLRQALGIDDATSPFAGAPTVRDHFEHYDERLDLWDEKSKTHNFFSASIGDLRASINPPPDDIDIFRNFDPATGIVHFWGDTFDLPAIIREAQRILPIAEGSTPWG